MVRGTGGLGGGTEELVLSLRLSVFHEARFGAPGPSHFQRLPLVGVGLLLGIGNGYVDVTAEYVANATLALQTGHVLNPPLSIIAYL